jgi:hypothetical protein
MEFLTYAVQLDLNMQALLHLRYAWFELKIWKATCFSPNYRTSIVWQIISFQALIDCWTVSQSNFPEYIMSICKD